MMDESRKYDSPPPWEIMPTKDLPKLMADKEQSGSTRLLAAILWELRMLNKTMRPNRGGGNYGGSQQGGGADDKMAEGWG